MVCMSPTYWNIPGGGSVVCLQCKSPASSETWFQAWNPTLPLSKPKGFVYPWKGQKAKMKAAIACWITTQYWKVERSRQIIIRKDTIIFIPFYWSYLTTCCLFYYIFFSRNELDLSFSMLYTCLVLCQHASLKAVCSKTGAPYQELLSQSPSQGL